jgi:MoaA/NifB/PqqE/SkfB family radical SAM enzyme
VDKALDFEEYLKLADLFFESGWVAKALELYQAIAANGYPVNQARFAELKMVNLEQAENLPELDSHEHLAVIDTGLLSTLHFTRELTAYQKRVAFKSGVRLIDVETSSQCNRRCHYCPNSKHDRLSSNTFMPDAVFDKLIEALASIDYTGALHFHGYNEPLMHIEDVTRRVAQAKASLKHAHFGLNTNADYLDPAALRALEACGLEYIILSVHLAPGKAWNERDIRDRVMRKSEELGLQMVQQEFQPDTVISCALVGSKLQISMREANYAVMGSTRGGALDAGIGAQTEGRTERCFTPLRYLIVGYKGDVAPCCDFGASIPEHRDYVIGNLGTDSLFDIYTNEKAWRRRCNALAEGSKMAPCDRCAGGSKRNLSVDVQRMIDAAIAARGGEIVPQPAL